MPLTRERLKKFEAQIRSTRIILYIMKWLFSINPTKYLIKPSTLPVLRVQSISKYGTFFDIVY